MRGNWLRFSGTTQKPLNLKPASITAHSEEMFTSASAAMLTNRESLMATKSIWVRCNLTFDQMLVGLYSISESVYIHWTLENEQLRNH